MGFRKEVIITRYSESPKIIVPLALSSSFWKAHPQKPQETKMEINWQKNQIMVIATDSLGRHGPSWASSRILPWFVVEQQNAKHHSVLDRHDRSMGMSQVQTIPLDLQILFPQPLTQQHSKQDQVLVPYNQQRLHIQETQIHLGPVGAKLTLEWHNLLCNFAKPTEGVKPFVVNDWW